jgi:8-oxo-dGTP pyrophosphatase MutT (NUDIX family)
MWLMTNIGFFSAVRKAGTDFLTIRARVKNDLDVLRAKYLPDLSATVGNAGTDYPWRATVSHASFAAAISKLVADIDYGNFKNEVAVRQGKGRAKRYQKVWEALYDLPDDVQPEPAHLPWNEKSPTGKKVAYGGVIFDAEGRVLLREPKNHFDGYVWTFPKGRPDPGETPEAAALREVKEETGVVAVICFPIPNEFVGGTTINRYFVMTTEVGGGYVHENDPETASIRWASIEEARKLIELTKNPTGRKRDIAVLDAAVALFSREIKQPST